MSPEKEPQHEQAEAEIVHVWYQKFGLYIVPTLFALLVGLVVYFAAMIHRKTEGNEEHLDLVPLPDQTFPVSLADSTNAHSNRSR